MTLPDNTPGPALLRARDAAAVLGVSARLLYSWVSHGVLPREVVVRAGRAIYLRRSALLAWAGCHDEGVQNGFTHSA